MGIFVQMNSGDFSKVPCTKIPIRYGVSPVLILVLIRRSSSTSVIVHSIPTGRGRTGSLNKCKVSIVGKLSSPHQIKLIKLDWGKPWEVGLNPRMNPVDLPLFLLPESCSDNPTQVQFNFVLPLRV